MQQSASVLHKIKDFYYAIVSYGKNHVLMMIIIAGVLELF